jgi:integrase
MRDKRVKVWIQEFKDRPHLVLQWIDPDTGKRKSETAETGNRKKAETARADKEYELNFGIYQEASRMTWDRFREMFSDEHLVGLRDRSREKYGTVFDVFEDEVGPKLLRGINERTLGAFVRGLRTRRRRGKSPGLEPITIRNYLIALKSALGWAKEQKLIPAVPTFPTVKVPKKKPQPVPTESFEKLLDKAPDELWRAYLLCGWWAGLRLSEAAGLRWDPSDKWPWLDLKGNRIVLPAEFAKSNEDQSVPLHKVLREALEALPRTSAKVFPFRSHRTGGPLTRNGITSFVRELAKRAGVKLSMHRLRKGFGCRVAKQLGKGNAPILHTLMRHSSMQITMDYYATVDDALQSAIGELT